MKNFELKLNGKDIQAKENYLEKGFIFSLISQDLPLMANQNKSESKKLLMMLSTKDKESTARVTQELKLGDVIKLKINLGD